ncbi:sulfur reduction protein DsrE [Enterococcus florum]|uniref:Sulfur reduction protein DsrE n=1 Tax=Enterococcus florum TaxID=2480627 RepID=A0A4V0WPT7_9ENTE|nr:DsrE family protein [Enterococcus florum]GCF94999.1 sulfur reduction protein DsrE [Enterococcus florum]
MKVAFHVDELGKLSEARHNIHNLLKVDPNATIVLLINGEAIQGYLLPNQMSFIENNPTVEFHACNSAMKVYRVEKSDLHEAVEVVPAGVMDLIRLQHDGFAYIKP